MTQTPLHVFNFRVEFFDETADSPDSVPLCGGEFAEVSGLEATMEPKAIRPGGHNNGDLQRVGRITYGTVVLKRGVTRSSHLWNWFNLVGQGKSAVRLRAELVQVETVPAGGAVGADAVSGPAVEIRDVLRWSMTNALPVKFKAATYVAIGGEVGVEELHFVHEGLTLSAGGGV